MEKAQTQVHDEMFCKLCSKHFTSANSFANHKQSKKHKDLEASALSSQKVATNGQPTPMETTAEVETSVSITTEAINVESIVCKSDRAAKKAVQQEEYLRKKEAEAAEMEELESLDEDEAEEGEWEDVADDSALLGWLPSFFL